ncbi:hypothetical protein [Micromonospora sp. S4605]|uniref:hypothetical protein n=1 Tax=Micromonospora sp. S4605 TaxID=1420897 RepID=UPI001E4866E5|nr:hypothetical protein [Micromonospora sp. S4605]
MALRPQRWRGREAASPQEAVLLAAGALLVEPPVDEPAELAEPEEPFDDEPLDPFDEPDVPAEEVSLFAGLLAPLLAVSEPDERESVR